MFEQITKNMIDFIAQNPSCYHVIRAFSKMLDTAGFVCLSETRSWTLQPGGKYYVTRGGSSLIAFKIPAEEMRNFQITAAHSDSPTFKIKNQPELFTEEHYVELNVERYGGAIFSPWFDRPLSIAGRAVVRNGDRLEEKLINIDRNLVVIPNAAIHMNRQVNEGYAYHVQKDLPPLFGDETARGAFARLLEEQLQTDPANILGTDLFLYSRTPASIWGASREFVSSARLDDLQCAYACMRGFLAGENAHSVCVCCVFDNEEVGSTTRQGANSTLLSDTLQRVNECLGRTPEEYKMAVASGFMISADNAHAVHPHHIDKADPINRPHMNRGPVIKFNANQKYMTDSLSAAIFKRLCERADVPCQVYTNHSDIAGGSTLGSISSAHVSMSTVDVGLAQLAMHSPYETAGVKDTAYLIAAVREFYNTHLAVAADGIHME